jgi:hypothetical protein
VEMVILESRTEGDVLEVTDACITHITIGPRSRMAFPDTCAWLESNVPENLLNTRRRWIIARNSHDMPKPRPKARPIMKDWAAAGARKHKLSADDKRLLAKYGHRFMGVPLGIPIAYLLNRLRQQEV